MRTLFWEKVSTTDARPCMRYSLLSTPAHSHRVSQKAYLPTSSPEQTQAMLSASLSTSAMAALVSAPMVALGDCDRAGVGRRTGMYFFITSLGVLIFAAINLHTGGFLRRCVVVSTPVKPWPMTNLSLGLLSDSRCHSADALVLDG